MDIARINSFFGKISLGVSILFFGLILLAGLSKMNFSVIGTGLTITLLIFLWPFYLWRIYKFFETKMSESSKEAVSIIILLINLVWLLFTSMNLLIIFLGILAGFMG